MDQELLDALSKAADEIVRLASLGRALDAYYVVARLRAESHGLDDTIEAILDRAAIKLLKGIYAVAEIEPPE